MARNYLITRLRDVLRKRHPQLTWKKISKDIARSNRDFAGITIDRRKLAHLCKASEDELLSEKFTIEQLSALDRYLDEIGEGYLFARHRSLLDSIIDGDTIDVFVPARTDKGTRNQTVSGWDMQAVADLFSTPLGRRDVRLQLIPAEKPLGLGDTRMRGSATISIGSPIASKATDFLFSKMLGRAADPVSSATHKREIPFFIVGRDTQDARLKSGFVRGRSFVPRGTQGAKQIKRGFRALIVGRNCFPADEGTDYAMLVAQRDPDTQQVCAVLSGLSGPGTFEVATVLSSDTGAPDLPRQDSEVRHPPILVAVYALTMSGDITFTTDKQSDGAPKLKKDLREVIDVDEACNPIWFHYDDGLWTSAPKS